MANRLRMKYFVLKPEGKDEYAFASRSAIRTYVRAISAIDSQLANDLEIWLDDIMNGAHSSGDNPNG